MTTLIKIEAKTNKGREVLRLQEEERKKMSFIVKHTFNKNFDVLAVGNVDIIELRFKNPEIAKCLNPEGLIERVRLGCVEKGAVEGIDFIILLEGF